MRRSKADKAATHKEIVKIAAKRFREFGLEGIGVAEIMKEAGVAVGGFYKHFSSRDDLVIEALAESFKYIDGLERGATDLPQLLTEYLSEDHCQSPGSGCPLSGLAGDVRNASTGVRALYTQRLKQSLENNAAMLPSGDDVQRRARAIFFMSAGFGAIAIARAVSDPELSREVLRTVLEQSSQIAKIQQNELPSPNPLAGTRN